LAKKALDSTVLDSYLQQLAAGDRDSFRKLYELLQEPIFLFALSLVKNRQTAQDILQECMLRIVRSAQQYQPGTNAKAWIFSIARNLCNDVLRDPHIRDLPLDAAKTFLGSPSDLTQPLEEAETVLAALQILSPQEREIVSLYVYTGLQQTEIAKALHLPYVRVRSIYKYAIKKLRVYFEKESEQP